MPPAWALCPLSCVHTLTGLDWQQLRATLIVFCGLRVGRVSARVCCPGEQEKMLKALIMSFWEMDLVQDKLDTCASAVIPQKTEGESSLAAFKFIWGPWGFMCRPHGAKRDQPHIPTQHTTLLGAYLFCIYFNRVMS